MKHLMKLGLATAMTLVATCGMVSVASATTIEPANTEGTLFSSNSVLSVDPEGAPVSCSSSTITIDTGPLTQTTWASATITTLTYTGCSALNGLIAANVTPSEGCHTPVGRPILHGMTVNPASAIGTITLPAACSIDIAVPAVGCTLTVTGGQNIGNDTAGAGGIQWTNLGPKSRAHLNNAVVEKVDSNGTGFGCPAAGNHTGTLSGTYNVTSPTNVTVTG
jgi:hypothetical protein